MENIKKQKKNLAHAGTGIGIGSAVAIIVVWILEDFIINAPVPSGVGEAMGALFTAATIAAARWRS